MSDANRVSAEVNGAEPFAEARGSASGRVERFKFDLRDKVIIREVQRPGVVEALTVDYLGAQYRVVYWDNSERKTTWLHADEIDPR
jgi:hypothetical protein